MVRITYKVPDGKLLKIKIELDDNNLIIAFQLRGDFFMYPEDGFLEIEKFVLGKTYGEALFRDLQQFTDKNGYEIFGFNSLNLYEAINSFLD